MADHFVDAVNGNNANSGHTMDAAWATVEYALESGSLTTGDIVWVRRNVSETPTTDISVGYAGSMNSPIRVIGCPRNSHSITSSDWTHGSTSVVVDDANMDTEKHVGRYITAPDGRVYLITRIVDASTITIDREYIGTTVTNQAATIQADEDYDLFGAIDDSAWTIKVATWRADADDLPKIDFNGGAYQIYYAADSFWKINNLHLCNSTDAYGVIYLYGASNFEMLGCLLTQTYDYPILCIRSSELIGRRLIIVGDGGSSEQAGIYGNLGYTALVQLYDSAVYGCYTGIKRVTGYLKNVNIGVEVENASYDIEAMGLSLYGIDCKLGGTNGYVSMSGSEVIFPIERISIENYQKVLGDHRTFFCGGYHERVTLTDATTPNKKLSDDALKITPNINYHATNSPYRAYKIFEHRVWADTSSKSYKYWIYNNMSAVINDATATDNLFMKVTYLSAYDDTSKYQYTSVYSSQIDIAQAADATDWDYLEVTGIAPAVAGWVIIEIYHAMYSASGTIYIDPLVVVS